MKSTQFYINGQWVDSKGGKSHAVINPATEESAGTITLGSGADTNAAVAAAKTALDSWSQTTKEERGEYLSAVLEQYLARADEMALAITTEMGAPIDLSTRAQTGAGIAHLKNAIQ